MKNEIVLSATSRKGFQYWEGLWRARELLLFLAWRDVLVRYKQTSLGILWAVLRPAMTTLVFTLVFSKIANLPSGEIPYPLLVLSGMAPWFYFSSTVTECGNSLISNSSLITKVYFPRLIVPLSSMLASLIDFTITCVMVSIAFVYYGSVANATLLFIPLMMLVLAFFALGCGIWVSALNARYRDVQFVVPFLLTFGLYLSPVGFSSAVVPESWRWLYNLNPMVGIIDGFRWCLFGPNFDFQWHSIFYTICISAALLLSGLTYFRRVERELVDIL